MYRSHSCNLVEELLSFISSDILSPNRYATTADKKLALIRGRSIITESSILDVAAVLDPLLLILYYLKHAGSFPRKANIFRVAPTIYSKFNSFTKCSNLKESMLLYGITERIQIRDYIQTNTQFSQIK